MRRDWYLGLWMWGSKGYVQLGITKQELTTRWNLVANADERNEEAEESERLQPQDARQDRVRL